MTPDDEAFVRAVVDRPGDDLPRLVYADWLDERGDPRGPYLRAEAGWAATRDPDGRAVLQRMAKGLDPVWVARVSRPPVGVCCEHLRLSATGDVNRPDAIDAAGDELGVALPLQLKALLLNYSLGFLASGAFVFTRGDEPRNWAVDAMVCLVDPDFDEETTSYELVDQTVHLRDEDSLPNGLVFLAGMHSENAVVSCLKSDAGAVYYWNSHEYYADKLAGTIGDFLAMLVPKAWPLTEDDYYPAH